jgi:tetratricopeptide (TPR) repeat protein
MSVIVVFSVCAGNDEELFLRGNKYYEQKDYDNALCSYDMISKKGSAVFYNMGNCAFQKGDYSHALVYWSRAEVGATAQEYRIIQRNKDHVLKKIGKLGDQPLRQRIVRAIQGMLPYVSLLFLQLFFLLCWYLFIFSARKKQTVVKKMVLICLCAIMVLTSTGLSVYYTKQSVSRAIITTKNALLFAGPDKGFQSLTSLAYADGVTVKEMREGWYKVRYADMIGWVEADVIQII